VIKPRQKYGHPYALQSALNKEGFEDRQSLIALAHLDLLLDL